MLRGYMLAYGDDAVAVTEQAPSPHLRLTPFYKQRRVTTLQHVIRPPTSDHTSSRGSRLLQKHL